MARIQVCPLSDLRPGSAVRVDVTPPVAVIRGESGDVFAIDDTCSHAEASLCEGYVEGDTVECPLHMAMFCLRTGKPTTPPATKPLLTHKVVIDDGVIYVEVAR